MKNITYIFGAGASCDVLPLNEEIPQRLANTIETLRGYHYKGEEEINHKNLLTDLEWLLSESRNHASVDTFAKKLYIKQNWERLKHLRLALSVFFTIEQIGKKPDRRYDAFFASLLSTHPHDLPKNIKILTWNYDIQFELSYLNFVESNLIEDAKHYLHIIEKFRKYREDSYEHFQLFKINGDISLREEDQYGEYRSKLLTNKLDVPLSRESYSEILSTWCDKRNRGDHFCSNISFAWEKNGNGTLEYTQSKLAPTEILIFIGYSLPYFNREIDRSIVSAMGNLEKVYIQAPDADDIAERYSALDSRRDIKLIPRFDKKQFLIPNEL